MSPTCPKCNAPLEPATILDIDGKTKQWKLQYGRKYEGVYKCSAGCLGAWTETNIKNFLAMRKSLDKHRGK